MRQLQEETTDEAYRRYNPHRGMLRTLARSTSFR